MEHEPRLEAAQRPATNQMSHSEDDLLVQLLDTVDEYAKLQQSCAQSLSAAFMALTQAKLSLGSKLSKLSYDGRMEPTASLDAVTEGLKLVGLNQASATKVVELKEVALEEVELKDVDTAANNGVRRRKDKSQQQDVAPSQKSTETIQPRKRDPLHMFGGILAPQTLRNAQQGFKDALADLVRLASVTRRIHALQAQLSTPLAESDDSDESRDDSDESRDDSDESRDGSDESRDGSDESRDGSDESRDGPDELRDESKDDFANEVEQ